MTDSPLMQSVDREAVERMRQIIKALERDKQNLARHVAELQDTLRSFGAVFCRACGTWRETQSARCDCTPGVDYDG